MPDPQDQRPDPATYGSWAPVIQLPNVPVHTHLLPDGKVLFWGRRANLDDASMDQHVCDAYVLDSESLAIRRKPQPQLPGGQPVNLFCSGHAFLPDGRLFVAGGHLFDGQGVNQACLYDWKTSSWSALTPMNHGRWYPSVNLLMDGSVLVTSGSYLEPPEPQQNNHVPQVWSESTGWRELTDQDAKGPVVLSLYPRIHVLRRDRVFVVGTDPAARFLNPNGKGIWSDAPSRAHGDRQYAPSVTYAPNKILSPLDGPQDDRRRLTVLTAPL